MKNLYFMTLQCSYIIYYKCYSFWKLFAGWKLAMVNYCAIKTKFAYSDELDWLIFNLHPSQSQF